MAAAAAQAAAAAATTAAATATEAADDSVTSATPRARGGAAEAWYGKRLLLAAPGAPEVEAVGVSCVCLRLRATLPMPDAASGRTEAAWQALRDAMAAAGGVTFRVQYRRKKTRSDGRAGLTELAPSPPSLLKRPSVTPTCFLVDAAFPSRKVDLTFLPL